MSTYQHTQRAPLCLLIYATAAMFVGIAWFVRGTPAASIGFLGGGVLMIVLAAGFHHLRVADEGDQLSIAFGPLPLFRRSVRYDAVEAVEVGRTTLLEGWGIHLSLRGGWVWNIWGRDCVVLSLGKGTLRVGTDDAERLAGILQERVADFRA